MKVKYATYFRLTVSLNMIISGKQMSCKGKLVSCTDQTLYGLFRTKRLVYMKYINEGQLFLFKSRTYQYLRNGKLGTGKRF